MSINWKTKSAWIILLIILAGILLRTFHFHDYLRFNPDQARDANIVRETVNGQRPLPLLGPKAGGTEFKLGPAFYYFQIASAKIFGNTPNKMAYPDLFFSVMAILLLYIFLKKYFSYKISLLISGLMAVSFFAVKYSRFAWNPNSTPFFVLLFLLALFEIGRAEQKRKWLWAIILGIAFGIGIQLHSLLLFSFPIVFAVYFLYLFLKKNTAWKKAWLIIAVIIFLNTPQIISEFKVLEKNSRAFIVALDTKSSRDATILKKIGTSIACQVQANGFIISSVGSDDKCDFLKVSSNLKENKKDPNKIFKNSAIIGNIILSAIFSLGGYILLVYFFRREKNTDKKNYLAAILIYAAVLSIIFIPMALEISMRFFLAIEFLPFIFLGLWIKFLGGCFGKKGMVASCILIAALAVFNLMAIKNKFDYLAGRNKSGSFDEITLGEVEFMANYILARSEGAKNVYLEGKKSDLFEIVKPIKYFTDGAGINVGEYSKNQKLNPQDKYFSVDIGKNNPEKSSDEKFGRMEIFESDLNKLKN